jgi:hypothetical protein
LVYELSNSNHYFMGHPFDDAVDFNKIEKKEIEKKKLKKNKVEESPTKDEKNNLSSFNKKYNIFYYYCGYDSKEFYTNTYLQERNYQYFYYNIEDIKFKNYKFFILFYYFFFFIIFSFFTFPSFLFLLSLDVEHWF